MSSKQEVSKIKVGSRVIVSTPDAGTTSRVRGKVEEVDERPTSISTETLYFVRLWNGDGQWFSPDRLSVDETDAASYVGISARGLIGDLRALIEIGERGRGNRSDDELERLGVSFDEVGCADVDDAWERLRKMPLAVEATTTFEVVLGCGGPSRELCFECNRVIEGEGSRGPDLFGYEIERVFYRYSWEGSAEVELTGEDRETAEAFGRRVVPELVE